MTKTAPFRRKWRLALLQAARAMAIASAFCASLPSSGRAASEGLAESGDVATMIRVRSGRHAEFVRLVFDVDSPFVYSAGSIASGLGLEVRLSSVHAPPNLANLGALEPPLTGISVLSDDGAVVRIVFAFDPGTRARVFSLPPTGSDAPYRLVVDFYPKADPARADELPRLATLHRYRPGIEIPPEEVIVRAEERLDEIPIEPKIGYVDSDVPEVGITTPDSGFLELPIRIPPNWRVRVGAGAYLRPNDIGSDSGSVKPFPYIDVAYKNAVYFRGDRLRINLLGSRKVRIGPEFRFRFGRSENDDPAYAGLGDIGDTVEGGVYFQVRALNLLFAGSLRQDLGSGHSGAIGELLVGAGLIRSGPITIGAGARLTWASANYMNSYFGVSPEQSVASGLAVYEPGAGLRHVESGIAFRYDFAGALNIAGGFGLRYLTNLAADSPIVSTYGDRTQFISAMVLRKEL